MAFAKREKMGDEWKSERGGKLKEEIEGAITRVAVVLVVLVVLIALVVLVLVVGRAERPPPRDPHGINRL